MSLVKKPILTPRRLAANRSNGRLSCGPATPEGIERMRAANLRHGFYSQAQGEALRALGEDPAEFEHLLESLMATWEPADHFQTRLVSRLARALWRMERGDRIQESMAVAAREDGRQRGAFGPRGQGGIRKEGDAPEVPHGGRRARGLFHQPPGNQAL